MGWFSQKLSCLCGVMIHIFNDRAGPWVPGGLLLQQHHSQKAPPQSWGACRCLPHPSEVGWALGSWTWVCSQLVPGSFMTGSRHSEEESNATGC